MPRASNAIRLTLVGSGLILLGYLEYRSWSEDESAPAATSSGASGWHHGGGHAYTSGRWLRAARGSTAVDRGGFGRAGRSAGGG